MPLATSLQETAASATDGREPRNRLETLALPFTDARLEMAYR